MSKSGSDAAVHIALVTAKGGNQTLKDKNLQEICGRPSVWWSLSAAQEAKLISEVFVTTECPMIGEVADEAGAHVIDRPRELSRPTSNHGDVILHGAKAAAEALDKPIASVTVLLGNTVMTAPADIDEAIQACSEPGIDSAMTVWKAQDDHPYRAMVIGEDGYLRSFIDDLKPDTNRQSYPDVYFYDQGPWTVKMASLLRCETTREGPGPWWWMGRNCVPIERLWVTGRDTHSQYDVDLAEWWLKQYRLVGRRNPGTIADYDPQPVEEPA